MAIITLASVLLSASAPAVVLGAALGASAVVPSIALRTGLELLAPSRRDARSIVRWSAYVFAGIVGAIFLGPLLVILLLACGVMECLASRPRLQQPRSLSSTVLAVLGVGTLSPLAWTALKVGALSFGGGFVIIPLMQSDAVSRHHWMNQQTFLAAVALGQITPGPVVQTVAVVGWAAAGLGGAALAALVVFLPSFLMIGLGGRHFERLRHSTAARGFLRGAGPAAIGAILGSTVALTRGIEHLWQVPVACLAFAALVIARRSVPLTMTIFAILGGLAALIGASTAA